MDIITPDYLKENKTLRCKKVLVMDDGEEVTTIGENYDFHESVDSNSPFYFIDDEDLRNNTQCNHLMSMKLINEYFEKPW